MVICSIATPHYVMIGQRHSHLLNFVVSKTAWFMRLFSLFFSLHFSLQRGVFLSIFSHFGWKMTFKHPDFRGFKSTRFSRLFSVLALETADFTTNIIYCYLLLLALDFSYLQICSADSKSFCRWWAGTWVRIPPSPPVECLYAQTRSWGTSFLQFFLSHRSGIFFATSL